MVILVGWPIFVCEANIAFGAIETSCLGNDRY